MFACGMTTWFPLESHIDYMWVSDVLFAGWSHDFPLNPTQTTCEQVMFCLWDDHMVSPRIPPKLHVSKRCSDCRMTTWFPLESHPDYMWVSDVLFAGWLHGFPSNPTQTTCELAMFCLRDDNMVSPRIPPKLHVSMRCSVCGMSTRFLLESHPDYLWVRYVLFAGWQHGFPSNPTQTSCELVMFSCGMTTWFPLESHIDYMWVSNVLFAGWSHGFPLNPTQTTCEQAMFCLWDDHMVSPRIPPKLNVSKRCSVCGMTTWFPHKSHPVYMWVSDVLFAGWLHGFPSNPTQTTCE